MTLQQVTRRHFEIVTGSLVGVVAFVIYLKTLCPTVNFIDSGELAAVACTLGIAHPTGYPLYTLLGWMFSQLPLGLRKIYQLNLLSALFCTAAVVIHFRFLVFLLGDILLKRSPKGGQSEKYDRKYYITVLIPAAVGSLIFAFSETAWSQALSVEVYPLHLVFLALNLIFFTRATQLDMIGDGTKTGTRNPYWHLFAFTLGLSFTNHLTTILLAPAFLYLYFTAGKGLSGSMQHLRTLVVPFLVGISIYLYLPVRASSSPILNWGNPGSIENLFQHLRGKQYSVWIFSSAETAIRQAKYFIAELPTEFSILALILAAAGVWSVFHENRRVFIFTLWLFFGCVLYAINYDINDIDSYFLLAYLTISIWVSAGIGYILLRLKKASILVMITLSLIPVILQVTSIWSRVDQSKMDLVERYTRDMLNSFEPDAVVLSYQWDYWVSAAYYLQHVEGVRTDVTIIDKELLRRTWYFDQLEGSYPWLISYSRKEIDEFLVELYKFEHDLPYNTNLIEFRFANVIRGFIEKNISSRPVYVTLEIEGKYTSGFQRVPSGLALRLIREGVPQPIRKETFLNPQFIPRNSYEREIRNLYARAYLNYALYSRVLGKQEDASRYLDASLQLEPGMPEALALKSKL